MRLDRVVSISEVAEIAGWSRRRMARHLIRLDRQNDGALLVNIGSGSRPRWSTTLGALQRLAPQWFVDAESMEARIAELEERIAHYERIIELHTARFVALRAERATLPPRAAD